MKSTINYFVLLATLYPVIWVVLYALSVFEPLNWPRHLFFLIGIGILTLVVYLQAIIRNRSLSRSQKVMWIFLLSLFGAITQLIYYVSHYRTK